MIHRPFASLGAGRPLSIRGYTAALLLVAVGGMILLGATMACLLRDLDGRAQGVSIAAANLHRVETLAQRLDECLAVRTAHPYLDVSADVEECRIDVEALSADLQAGEFETLSELTTVLADLTSAGLSRPYRPLTTDAAELALEARLRKARDRLVTMASESVERAGQDLSHGRLSWTWVVGGMILLYVFVLVLVQRRVSNAIATPMRTLSNAAHRAMVHHEPMGSTSGGPTEVRELTTTILSFIDRLETRVRDRTQELNGLNANLRLVNATLQKEVALRRSMEERLRHDALHDNLTQLPNRHLIMDRLRLSMERARRDQEYGLAVLFLDVDNFKIVNDSLGHSVGDLLLIEVSRRLEACLRGLDTVGRVAHSTTGRLGGDEFIILLEGVQSEHDAIMVAERVQEQLSVPVQLDGHPVAVSASIGIVMHDGRAVEPEEFIRDADTAMYRAKQAGKMQHAVFDKTMHVAAKSRLKLENELRLALDRGEFKLHYQPIVALDSGQITAFEALLRWDRPDLASGAPTDYVRLAEETGLILPIGRWALEKACRTLRAWHDRHPECHGVSMNVNIARRQLLAPGFCNDLERILEETGIEANRINLELTESTVIEAFSRLPTVLQRVKDLGFRLYMDDFGTGYSSLSCLHDFPIDVLKIDRSFVGTMGSNRDYAVIVHSIMTLARHLEMRVVAEGIEQQPDLASLRALDCDFGQGYYFSQPVDEHEALHLALHGGSWLNAKPASKRTSSRPRRRQTATK